MTGLHPASRRQAALFTEEYRSGLNLRQIGERHGLTRERVRQLIERTEPGLIASTFAARQAARSAATAARRQAEWEAKPRHVCRVCGETFKVSMRTATCSPVCERAWSVARPLFDPERYRGAQLSQARHLIRHADTSRPSAVEWARRFLDHYEQTGEVLPPNRRFAVVGSVRWNAVVAAVGEERTRELYYGSAVTADE